MRQKRTSEPASLRRLLRFLAGYGLALIVLLQVLPAAAVFVQGLYDDLDVPARLALVASLVAVATAWQLHHYRVRSRVQRPSFDRGGERGEQ